MGDEKYAEVQDIIADILNDDKNKTNLVRWKDVLENENYKNSLFVIKEEFTKNPEFYSYIIDIVKNGRKDRIETISKLSKEHLDRLAEYILNELPHFVNGVQGYGDDTVYTLIPYPGINNMIYSLI